MICSSKTEKTELSIKAKSVGKRLRTVYDLKDSEGGLLASFNTLQDAVIALWLCSGKSMNQSELYFVKVLLKEQDKKEEKTDEQSTSTKQDDED